MVLKNWQFTGPFLRPPDANEVEESFWKCCSLAISGERWKSAGPKGLDESAQNTPTLHVWTPKARTLPADKAKTSKESAAIKDSKVRGPKVWVDSAKQQEPHQQPCEHLDVESSGGGTSCVDRVTRLNVTIAHLLQNFDGRTFCTTGCDPSGTHRNVRTFDRRASFIDNGDALSSTYPYIMNDRDCGSGTSCYDNDRKASSIYLLRQST